MTRTHSRSFLIGYGVLTFFAVAFWLVNVAVVAVMDASEPFDIGEREVPLLLSVTAASVILGALAMFLGQKRVEVSLVSQVLAASCTIGGSVATWVLINDSTIDTVRGPSNGMMLAVCGLPLL